MTDLSILASKLSEAQKRALDDAYFGQRGWTLQWHYKALDRHGVTTGRCLTPLGLSLRSYLKGLEE